MKTPRPKRVDFIKTPESDRIEELAEMIEQAWSYVARNQSLGRAEMATYAVEQEIRLMEQELQECLKKR